MFIYFIIFALCLLIVKIYYSLKKCRERCAELEALNAELKTLAEKPNVISAKDYEIDYFKSDLDRILFLLLEVDGKRRNELLGITSEMYENKEAAKKWYKSLSFKIHPDKNPDDPRAAEAFDKLKGIYDKIAF